MLKNKIIELINLSEIEDKDKIKSLLLSSVGFKLEEVKKESNLSKIGGYPSILENNWPLYNDRPLLFLGEISLREIEKLNNILPKEGLLCFFICIENIGSRFPEEKGEFKVKYIQENNLNLTKTNHENVLNHSLSFFEYYTFPSYQENIIQKENISEKDLEIVNDIENDIEILLDENYDIEHQLLGHPKAVQGTVRFWWAKKYLGLDSATELTKQEIDLINKEEDKFILLMQINFGDSKIGIDYFGDSIAYFGIHKDDLQKNNFDNTILVMQNT